MMIFFLSLFLCFYSKIVSRNIDNLPSFRLSSSENSLSGVSAGGAFAQQMHIAFSSEFRGVGSIAGPPYYCSLGLLETALTACMSTPSLMSLDLMWSGLETAVEMGWVDDTANLKDSRVWLYTGMKDTVVDPGVVKNGMRFYQNYMPSSHISITDTVASEHAWITAGYGNTCAHLGTPFINDCALDVAGELLGWIYANETLNPPAKAYNTSNLRPFSQKPYVLNVPAAISLGDLGYYYAPEACLQGAECRLHVAFHGCEMTLAAVGTQFVENAGLNEWAETNNIVVLYPQAIESDVPYNPKGCFEWWAYISPGETYPTKLGLQMAVVKKMIDAMKR